MIYTLRPYQQQSVDSIEQTLANGNKSALVVVPTGGGKTIIFSAVIEKEVERGGRVLILAHRTKLLDQAHDKLLASCNIDASYDGKAGGDERVVISSVQAMSRENRLNNYPADYFSMIIVDEAHHIASPSYKKVVDHFTEAKLVGVTATPVRGDRTDVGELFDEVCYKYEMLDAIRDGYLSPLHVKKCPLQIDISGVHMQSGDYAAGELGNAIEPYLVKIAKQIKERAVGRKIIVFVPLVATARKLAEIFENEGIRSEYVAGERKESDEILEDFEHGRYDVIVNSMLLTEGYDCPSIDCVINLRPTKSESLYKQIIGRGTRLSPNKENCLVLDFLWQDNGRGQLNAQDVVLNETDEEMRRLMEKLARKGEEVDVFDLQEEAKRSLEHEREKALVEAIQRANEEKELREREQQQNRQLRERLRQYAETKSLETGMPANQIKAVIRPNSKTKTLYHCMSGEIVKAKVDDKVLETLGINEFVPIFSSDTEPPTAGQRSFLSKFGIPEDLVIYKGHASDIITNILSRKSRGLGTYKQVQFLINHNIKNAEFFTANECASIMSSLSHHGWKMNSETQSIINRCEEAMER